MAYPVLALGPPEPDDTLFTVPSVQLEYSLPSGGGHLSVGVVDGDGSSEGVLGRWG